MKMAMEGRSGKSNCQNWPHFLNRVIPPAIWQAFCGHVGWQRRADARWSAKYVVLCWVRMAWSTQGQLTERFRENWEVLTQLFPRRRGPGHSYQGLMKATRVMGDGILVQFWACLRETIPKRVGRRWQWYGWVVMAVDGSRVDAARTRSNERTLRIAGGTKTHPQWWVTVISHLPTNLLWDWRQGPGTSDERSHLRHMLPALPCSTLLVGDSGTRLCLGYLPADVDSDRTRAPADILRVIDLPNGAGTYSVWLDVQLPECPCGEGYLGMGFGDSGGSSARGYDFAGQFVSALTTDAW